ncbi:type VII toxin-antitoxin system MntA family adenylyltransferase antitoxin [Leptospira levettii]|uniref:type VII toxin-antitoxin system MntA family adenylyltransferase antitoxin n=1 Tax=Leptospira levettii TaxID=2023178 RepID=UPI00223CFEC6|nr:nucleotidyltransferase domain-containing protein [Leptospira levettii]MCW7472007.1 nucleotidyltransferase domain-containing protein [Leptospira levettii]
MKTTLSEKEIESIVDYFSKVPEVLAVYLLGSAAKDTMRPGSDIDLAILPFEGISISGTELFKFAGDLGYQLGLDFDLGEMSSRNLVYSKEAIFSGKAILVKDKPKVELRTNTLISMYFNFQIERREVLNAYRK